MCAIPNVCRMNIYGVSRVALLWPLWPFWRPPTSSWPLTLLQKWVMAAIPAFTTPNTDFEKVDSKLLSRHRAACKLLFVCFLCGCPLQHAEQDKAWKLTSTCEMGFRLFVRFASDLHLLSRLNWHLISTHLLQSVKVTNSMVWSSTFSLTLY